MKQTDLNIEGMRCDGCATGVRDALQHVPGVHHVLVDLVSARAAIEHEDTVTLEALAASVRGAGYTVALPLE